MKAFPYPEGTSYSSCCLENSDSDPPQITGCDEMHAPVTVAPGLLIATSPCTPCHLLAFPTYNTSNYHLKTPLMPLGAIPRFWWQHGARARSLFGRSSLCYLTLQVWTQDCCKSKSALVKSFKRSMSHSTVCQVRLIISHKLQWDVVNYFNAPKNF